MTTYIPACPVTLLTLAEGPTPAAVAAVTLHVYCLNGSSPVSVAFLNDELLVIISLL